MKLFMIHVGFCDKAVGMYELHSNIFIVANNVKEAINNVKNKEIYINKKMHIDSVLEIKNIDGYDINLSKNEASQNNNLTYDYYQLMNL